MRGRGAMFREQVSTVSHWFDRWSPCEQTVALVALLRRLRPTQARFVGTILTKQLNESPDFRRTEILANDANFVASLASTESTDTLMRDLLAYLPLLNPKSTEVKTVYIALVSKVMKHVLDHCALHDDARQLLSYCLIHPAFNHEDKAAFSQLLRQFEEKQMTIMNMGSNRDDPSLHYPSSLSGSPPGGHDWQQNNSPPNNTGSLSGSPGTQSVLSVSNFMGMGNNSNIQRIRRSNSLTPPVIHSEAWNSEELCSLKPRSLSLSSEVSPQGSLASSGSGSETHLDDQRQTFTAPGMKDVQHWLKSLRLHKYAFLFGHVTYEEMMTMNEERLEKQGVTKGARHKIILSIAKLKERPNQLKQLYDSLLTEDKETVRNTLSEIKWMLTTPIKPMHLTATKSEGEGEGAPQPQGPAPSVSPPGPIGSGTSTSPSSSDEDDLPEKIVSVIRKACERSLDMESEGLLISILDRCLSHEAFNPKQKRLLTLLRQQQAPVGRRGSGTGGNHHFHGGPHHRASSSPGCGNNGNGKNRHFSARLLNLPNANSPWGNNGNSIQAMFMAKRPSLQDSILESVRNSHITVQRTKSAPLPFFASLSSSPPIFDMLGPMGSTPSDILAGLNFATDPAGLIGGGGGLGSGGGGDNNPSTHQTGGGSGQQSSAMDITSRLESLCLSMTEAALGPAFNSY